MSVEETLNFSRKTGSKTWLGVGGGEEEFTQLQFIRILEIKKVKRNVISTEYQIGDLKKYFMRPRFKPWLVGLLAM